MTGGIQSPIMPSRTVRWLAVAVLAGVGAPRLVAQTPTFEVVSVKPSPPPAPGPVRIGIGITPGRWDATFVTLMNVIRNAYPEFPTEAQIVGGPDWIRTTRYDIAATMAGEPPRDQIREMVRDLLVRRFGIKTRIESRAMDAYALILARSDGRLGPNVRPSTVDCEALAAAVKRGERPRDLPQAPGQPRRVECGMQSSLSIGRERIVVSAQRLSFLIGTLTNAAGRPVVDRTGLTGVYDFELEYASDRRRPPADAPPDPNPAPSIFTAVQEQLGLKLEGRKEMLDVLVIQDAHLPTPD